MASKLSFLLLPLLAAASCSNGVGQAKVGTVTGTVLKGAVSGAALVAYNGANGRKGEEIGTGTSDESGAFSFAVGSHSGPIVVCATRGTYTEEATGGLVQLGTNELCGLIKAHDAGATSSVLLTPLTTLHVALTGCFLDAGRDPDLATAEAHSAVRLNDFFAAGQVGFDLRSTVPLDPTIGIAPSFTPEAWAGILVAGLSESAKGYAVASGLDPGVRVTAATLTSALTQDIDDGACLFDGRTSTARIIQGNIELNENALRGSPQGLSTSILRFLESPRNLSGISQENVRDLVQVMQQHRSEIFGGDGGGSDIDGPNVDITEPLAGALVGGLVRVAVTAVDTSPIVELAFLAPAQAAFTASTFTCSDEERTTCTLVGSINTSREPIVDGPVTVEVRAVDSAGNPTTVSRTINVNNSLPTITVTAPPIDLAVEGTRTITAEADDADGIDSLVVDIPGIGRCSSSPDADVADLEPATDKLSCLWDTTSSPEGPTTLLFQAVDGAGQSKESTHRVVVDNSDVSTINGFVDVGAPVVGATVNVLEWTGRVRGRVLGTATSDPTGAYSIPLDDEDHASVLIVATGGFFVDLATGAELRVAEGQELTSAVGALLAGDDRVANVNAWTTLAAARAKHTPITTDDDLAIRTNNSLLSQHLRRVPLGTPFSVATTRSADLTTETVTLSDQRAVLALSHAALSRSAAEIGVNAGAVGTVTLLELVGALALDLNSDPLLDGIGAGDVLTIGPNNVPLTSLTTRFDLAASLDRWLVEAPLQGANVDQNNSGITRVDALNGRLYEALSEDNRGELYPDAGRPFDTEAPTIDLTFGGANQSAQPGDALRGVVQINGDAEDEAGDVVVFGATLTADGTFLPDDDGAEERLRVVIGTDILPNASASAEACAAAPDAIDVEVLVDAVCVCAIAEDEQANIAERILCFTRPLPEPTITSPDLGTRFRSGTLVQLAATAASGFDLDRCEATISGGSGAPATISPIVIGPGCSFTQTIPTDDFTDASWIFKFSATDKAGREQSVERTFTTDVTPPSLTVATPTQGSVRNQRSIQADGSIAGQQDLASIKIQLLRNQQIVAESIAPIAPTATNWALSVSETCTACVDGPVQLVATATDASGNTSIPAIVSLSFDTTPPQLGLAAVQLPIKNYSETQPVSRGPAFTCPSAGPCIDKRPFLLGSTATDLVFSRIFAASAGSVVEPIVRWENLLGDSRDMPTVTFNVTDAAPQAVLFSIAESCASPTLPAVQIDGSTYRVGFTAENMAVRAARLRAMNGTTTMCLTARAIDQAGNPSNTIQRFFKWRTLAPPIPVTTIQNNLSTSALTWPNGERDAGSFTGFEVDNWISGNAAVTYIVSHVYLHNPYSVQVQTQVIVPTQTASIKLAATAAKVERWSTESIPKIQRTPTDPAVTLTHPKQVGNNTLTTPRTWLFAAAGSYANNFIWNVDAMTGTGFKQLGGDVTLSRVTPSATKPVTQPELLSKSVGDTLAFVGSRAFTVSANGTPLASKALDPAGRLTLAPGETVIVAFESRNTAQTVFSVFDNASAKTQIDAASTTAFLAADPGTPSLATPPSPDSALLGSIIYMKKFQNADVSPKVRVWAQTSRSSPGGCAAGECALGRTWSQLKGVTAEASAPMSVTLLTSMGSATGPQAVQWSTGDTIQGVTRSVTAPGPQIIIVIP